RIACFSLLIPPLPESTLFPYTTLFRSQAMGGASFADVQDPSAVTDNPARLSRLDAKSIFLYHSQFIGDLQYDRLRVQAAEPGRVDRKSTRLNSSHLVISYAVFCLKKKK